MIRKLLSGEKSVDNQDHQEAKQDTCHDDADLPKEQRKWQRNKGKRVCSGDASGLSSTNSQKKKRLQQSTSTLSSPREEGSSDSEDDYESSDQATMLPKDDETPKLPAEMPDWGIKLLEIMQMEF